MESLNQLFQDILHSEQNFNNRLTYLKELNSQIDTSHRELIDTKGTTELLKGQLVLKSQSLVDCEVNCKLAQVEQNIAQEKKNEIQLINRELKNKLDKLSENTDQTRQEMMSELMEFNKSYDLTGSGINYRVNQTQKQLELLEEEMTLLETEFAEYEHQEEECKKLESKLNEKKSDLEKQLKTKSVLESEVELLTIEKDKLEKEKILLNEQLNEDPDLKKLKRELESCRNDPIERQCNQLKEEIEILQKKCYKKQMKYAQRDTPIHRTTSHATSKQRTPTHHMTSSRQGPPTHHMTSNQHTPTHRTINKPQIIDLTTNIMTDESDWEFDENELVSIDVLESLHDLNEQEFDHFEFSNSNDSDSESDGDTNYNDATHILHDSTHTVNSSSGALKRPLIEGTPNVSLGLTVKRDTNNSRPLLKSGTIDSDSLRIESGTMNKRSSGTMLSTTSTGSMQQGQRQHNSKERLKSTKKVRFCY